ncbi:MAG: beta-ketoacyl synthase chain length factor, partial [Treponema sp.]|nr:beta-ketoacyl synthase chain length factor [Treponema sp.]
MTLFATKPACWAPGLAGDVDWKDWLEGRRAIERTDAQPPLSFTPPLFRRRLSQLSRMTVQVVHDALELAGVSAGEGAGADAAGRTGAAGAAEGAVAGTAVEEGGGTAEEPRAGTAGLKQSFVSFRGELSRQLSINKTLITEQDVLPASFSLSVFNTPMALASMACHLTGGYSVLFPPADSFYDGLCTACAPLLCGEEDRLLFVYADENVPAEYAAFCPDNADPLAFATVLSARPLHEGGRQQTDNGGLQAGDSNPQAGGGAFSFELSDVAGKT